MASSVVILVSSGVLWVSLSVILVSSKVKDFVGGYMTASVAILISYAFSWSLYAFLQCIY